MALMMMLTVIVSMKSDVDTKTDVVTTHFWKRGSPGKANYLALLYMCGTFLQIKCDG